MTGYLPFTEDLGKVLMSIGCESRLKPEYNGKYYDLGINEEGYPKTGIKNEK